MDNKPLSANYPHDDYMLRQINKLKNRYHELKDDKEMFHYEYEQLVDEFLYKLSKRYYISPHLMATKFMELKDYTRENPA